jgi:hypothetical protein
MIHKATGNPFPNRCVTLSATSPRPGHEVCTFAYPKTTIIPGKPQEIHFAPTYFTGQVEEYLPDGRDSVLLPCPVYRTSMVLHGGASGGPVFGPDGGAFAVNSTGFGQDELSYVSCLWEAIDLVIPNVQFPQESKPRSTCLRELIKLGHVTVK